MVLPIPKTVEDRSLLEQEPFKTYFEVQKYQGEPLSDRKTNARPRLFADIERAMRAEPSGLNAARAWLMTVFRKESDLSPKELDVFTQFYWLLSQEGKRRDMLDLLYRESKSRGLYATCSFAASVIEYPKASTPLSAQNSNTQGEPDNVLHPKHDAAVSIVRRRSQRFRPSEHGVPVSAPVKSIGNSSGVARMTKGSAATAPFTQDIQDAVLLSPKKKRGRKRKEKKAPPSTSRGSVDERPVLTRFAHYNDTGLLSDSPLTPLPSDSEEEPLTHALPQTTIPSHDFQAEAVTSKESQTVLVARPSKGVRTAPSRKASHRDRLSKLMDGENEYKASKSKGKVDAWLLRATESTSTAPRTTNLPPRKSRALTRKGDTKKSKVTRAVHTADDRPGKRRRGNDGTALVDTGMLGDIAKSTKQQKSRKLTHISDAPRRSNPPGGQNAKGQLQLTGSVSVPPASPALKTLAASDRERRNLKRSREEAMNTHTQLESIETTQTRRERLPTVALPSRRPRNESTAPCAVDPNEIHPVDDMLSDAGTNGLILLNNPEEQAETWNHDPDDPQPYDSSGDGYEPLSRTAVSKRPMGISISANAVREGVPSAVKSQTQTCAAKSSQPHPVPLFTGLEDGEILEDKERFPQDDLHELTYSHLTACPLFHDDGHLQSRVKLPLPALPPIWAQSRQEVCESFDWFRSYQGGVYFVKDLVKGYLLSAFSASRDLFYRGGKLVISHGGGKAAQSLAKAPGTVVASDQQENDKSVRALLHNYRTRRPLVLIIDDKYALFPYDLESKGCAYAILGWYQIAYAWAEFQPDPSVPSGRVVRYKFAFQWCEGQGTPWWNSFTQSSDAPAPSLELSAPEYNTDDKPGEVCKHCDNWTPQVYEEGWMCLKPRCFAFWHFNKATESPFSLNYSAAFLRPVDLHTDQILEDLCPPLPVSQVPQDRVTTSRHFYKGWHCTKCGRLSSRYKWEHWECRSCENTYSIPGRLRTANEFLATPKGKLYTHKINPGSGILQQQYQFFKSGKTFGSRVTFALPYGRGYIHALLSKPTMNEAANAILRDYQDQAASGSLKFRRWPLRSHKCRGTLLTNYFSQNTGEPYQYVGGSANTVPFDGAPTAVVDALSLIKQRITESGIAIAADFNEVLTAAYMEEQKMAFHSDAERGLGPNVASLSLGAGAYMHFRLHAQYAAQEMPGTSNREILTLFLRHGDVVVMEGADIQKYYEHTVVPLNFRIAATARLIGREHHGF